MPDDLTFLLDIFNYLGCSEGLEMFCCGHLQLLVLTHNNLSCIREVSVEPLCNMGSMQLTKNP